MSAPLPNYTEVSIPTVDDDENTWGGINNGAHQLWDRAVGGRHTVVATGGTVTLSATEAQNGHIQFTGALVSDLRIVFPTGRFRSYRVRNSTTGNFAVTLTTDVAASEEVSVPPFSSMMAALNGNNVHALGPPVERGGGFRNFFRQAGKSYDGPGVFFQDLVAGFARRAAGVIGVNLLDSNGGDQIRFQGANTAAAPLIGMAPDGSSSFDTGFIPATDGGVRSMQLVTNGAVRGRIREGVVLGSAANGDQGVGALNASSGVFVNGIRLLVPVELTPIDVPATVASANHNLGAKPRYVAAVLRCVIADRGYAPNDDVQITEMGSSSSVVHAAIWYNQTQVGLSTPSGQQFAMAHKTTGTIGGITTSRWRLVFTVAR